MSNHALSTGVRLAHVNLVARDWRRLAQFYIDVFGCTMVPPERNLSGAWLERATGVSRARIEGVHLRFPGGNFDSPTLEIFRYEPLGHECPRSIHSPGIGHLALSVADVTKASAAVARHGGRTIGERVMCDIPGTGTLEFQYVADLEGNAIELQHWQS